VTTELQSNRFVSPTSLNGVSRIRIAKRRLGLIGARGSQRVILLLRSRLAPAANKTFAPNHSGAEDRYVHQVLSPDQAVVPVTVPEVLIFIPFIRFGRIILDLIRSVGRDNRCALIEIQRDIAFEMNRYRQVISCRKINGAASGGSRRLDAPVDRRSVEYFPIANRTKRFNVKKCGVGYRLRRRGCDMTCRSTERNRRDERG